MSKEKTNSPSSEKEYTQEELDEMKAKAIRFYQNELPALKSQEEYEKILADIEEHRVRKLIALYKQASISMQEKEAKKESLTGESKNPSLSTDKTISKNK